MAVEEVEGELSLVWEQFAAEQTTELYLMDLSLLHLLVMTVNVTSQLDQILANEHSVFTEFAPHSPEILRDDDEVERKELLVAGDPPPDVEKGVLQEVLT